ncbi:shikimate kinase AroL [Maridesulfovibrio ferrireducens]|uniref:shikimate kinase AroL n=1 Tax=Maridesulfovibrio ferrireducens TaxID=246191 RepID=UPI001A31473A|nr:shikimate kinase AroL [Maridesulfovibrio ferrireducens]MBI9112495.1 shikimate kinase AroL [Maridesulfovibrio ferrireducens]
MNKIFLVGPRACGKTTVGRAVAKGLQFDFYDSDALIVEKAGCEISTFVEANGWEAFRDLESDVFKSLSEIERAVVSCGGGIVVREKNFEILKKGFTVYLKTDVDTLVQRLSANPEHGQRPSLTGKSLMEEISEILEAREKLYSGCAAVTVDGAGSVQEICERIVGAFKIIENGDYK